MQILGDFFRTIFNYCLSISNNYWLAIIVFTLLSKILLLPISIIVQINSIKMVKMYPEINRIKATYFGNNDIISEKQYELYKREKYKPILDIIPAIVQVIVLMGVVEGFPETAIERNIFIIIGATLSSLILCLAQNKANVLQQEQSTLNKTIVMLFSVSLSLFLALFVSKFVAFYWICSNLMSTIQLFLLNIAINPKKHIDYKELEESKKELEEVKKQNNLNKKNRNKELIKRENNDYKRFIKYDNKQVVFYSEKNGFYKYYKDIIEIILKKTDIIIHYISSDPNDEIFKLTSDNFQTYYIDEKLMMLMMRMDADVVVMTTPDLQNYYIKRSMVRNDIEYIYIDHSTNSMNLTYHKNALEHFDTVFVQNEKSYEELLAQEEKYCFKKKNLVKVGFPLIDNMIESYNSDDKKENDVKKILIAPSWQDRNILDLCIDDLLDQLLKTDYQIILRPHPQYIRLYGEKVNRIKEKYADYSNFVLEDDFSSNKTVYDADILITDWSAISLEYSFTTLKPVIFINTPMKVINEEYKDIDVVPFDIESRSLLGIEIEVDKIYQINDKINDLLNNNTKYSKENIETIRDNYLFNIGKSAKYGAKYIVESLIKKSEEQVIEEKPSTKEIKENKSFASKFVNALCVSLLFCLMLFFFFPIEIYVGNYNDFLFPIDVTWWLLLLTALIMALLISIIISIFPYSISKYLCFLELIASILVYTQTVFLNGHVESLFATNVNNDFSKGLCIINLLFWVIIPIVATILYHRIPTIKREYKKYSIYICIFLILIQSYAFITSIVNIPKKEEIGNYLSIDNEYELSYDDNTIVFVLDMCDGDYVKSTLEKYPDLFDNLDGFTYYPDATTTYSKTYPSIPYLLTGTECNYDLPYKEYIKTAWGESDYISNLKNNGTNIGLYTQSDFVNPKNKNDVDNNRYYNCYDIDSINIEVLIKEMTLLSLYRCSPYCIKTMISEYYPSDVGRIIGFDNKCIQYDDVAFYNTLVDKQLSISKDYDKAFRFYHFFGTHKKLNVDISEEEANKTSSIEDTLYADFKILKEYFKQMKELNIYDKAKIIITTDHGIHAKEIRENSTLTGLVVVKEAYNDNEFRISQTSICHNDLLPFIYGNDEIEFKDEKRYINIAYNDDSERYLYEISGDARDYDNWTLIDSYDIKYSMKVK